MIKTGLVYTNDNCIGCHRCISVCPVITANHAVELDDGTCRIEVDGAKCIACGACFDACEHHARSFRDDTERFFEDLEKGESISILWAPAFAANYPDEYERILGGLKQMGANHIISIGFGADITTWGYLNYIMEHDFYGGISQPCPAIVNYIEHFVPELIPKLVPIHSPLMCGAVYVKKYMKIDDKLAFISPCIAKKHEINDENTGGLVSYNVTFEHLMQYAKKHNIFSDPVPNEIEYGLGSIYPMPGGLGENIYWFCGEDVFIRQIEGEKRAYHFLENYKERVLSGKELPFMVDALNCSAGCLYGTGVEESKDNFDDTLYELMHIKNKTKNGYNSGAWGESTPDERLRALNTQFGDLDINDFIRHYTDKSAGCKIIEPDNAKRQEIFDSMKKVTKEKQNINCSACGYDTCSQMVTAIFNGCNQAGNCVHYSKDIIRDEKHAVTKLLEEMEIEEATSTARTHYMEGLYTSIAHDINNWRQEVSAAIDSDDQSEKERILESIKDRGNEIVEFIQNTLVSIRRTSNSLNLKESIYSPEALLHECIQFINNMDTGRNITLKLTSGYIPKSVYGDRDKVFFVLTAILYEMLQSTSEDIILTFSADKREYAILMKITIEAPDPSCGDSQYSRFDEYLQSRHGRSDTISDSLAYASSSDLPMVDVSLRQMFGSLDIVSASGRGWICTLNFPQLEEPETIHNKGADTR